TFENNFEDISIICDVPQGTTLSPTLLNIKYINQINYLNTHGKLVFYADDTVFFVEGQSWDEVFASVQFGMIKIQKLAKKLMYAFKNLTDILELKTIQVGGTVGNLYNN
ncbi:neuroblastoma-amplified sequence-like, partial [Aphis craccivora]